MWLTIQHTHVRLLHLPPKRGGGVLQLHSYLYIEHRVGLATLVVREWVANESECVRICLCDIYTMRDFLLSYVWSVCAIIVAAVIFYFISLHLLFFPSLVSHKFIPFSFHLHTFTISFHLWVGAAKQDNGYCFCCRLLFLSRYNHLLLKISVA